MRSSRDLPHACEVAAGLTSNAALIEDLGDAAKVLRGAGFGRRKAATKEAIIDLLSKGWVLALIDNHYWLLHHDSAVLARRNSARAALRDMPFAPRNISCWILPKDK